MSRTILIAAAVAAGLFLAWMAAETLLLVFAGILLGVLLDALARALGYALPIGHGWRLAIVCLILLGAIAGTLAWSGYALASEWDQLARILSAQLKALRDEIDNLGLTPPSTGKDDIQTLAQMLLPDPSRLFGGARSAFSAALGILGSTIVVLLIGIFAAANPQLYRAGVLMLVPPARRPRVGEVLDEMGTTLRWWLIGQLATMALVGITVGFALALLGVPGAMLLGVQAALVNFIPYLGPFLAAVPILLAAASLGLSTALWTLAVYMLIQTIEGYVVMPLVQKRAVNVPPVLALASLMLFGALFGAAGIAMAIPLVAVLRVAVLRLYVEDVLHNKDEPRQRPAAA
jgi:predicted PurR-regulated permease PerM